MPLRLPPNWLLYQDKRRLFCENGSFGPLFAALGVVIAAAALSSSDVMRASISLPILGILMTAVLFRIYRPWLKKLELEPRDQKITLAVCLGVSLLPPLTATFLLWGCSVLLWVFFYAGLHFWLLYWLGGRGPIRSEVEADLAVGQATVNRAKEALEQIEKDKPATDAEKAKSAEAERIKKERDEKLAVLEEAMRNSDEPLDPVTASAQFQQIQTDYREALGRLAS